MTDTPSLEDRLVAWLAYLGSEKAETTPIASVVCPTGESLADDLRAALATLQPSGERREAIARAVRSVLMDGLESNDPGNWLVPMDAEDIGDLCEHVADTILASGLVQDEAAIRADEREKCAKIADLFVNHDAEYGAKYPDEAFKFDNRWLRSKTIADAIRSARNGGAS